MSEHKGETERNTSIKKQRDSSVLSVSAKCNVTWMLSPFLFVSDNLDTLMSLSSEIDLPAPNSILNVKDSETFQESLLEHGSCGCYYHGIPNISSASARCRYIHLMFLNLIPYSLCILCGLISRMLGH